MSAQFTPLYKKLRESRELTSTEKILVAWIIQRGKGGEFQRKQYLAHDIGISISTLKRTKKKLIEMRPPWIIEVKDGRRSILFINDEKLKGMEVFGCVQGCGKPVRYAVKSRGIIGRTLHKIGVILRPLFIRKKISYKKHEDIRELIDYFSSKKIENTRMTKAEFEARRQEFHKQLEDK